MSIEPCFGHMLGSVLAKLLYHPNSIPSTLSFCLQIGFNINCIHGYDFTIFAVPWFLSSLKSEYRFAYAYQVARYGNHSFKAWDRLCSGVKVMPNTWSMQVQPVPVKNEYPSMWTKVWNKYFQNPELPICYLSLHNSNHSGLHVIFDLLPENSRS